jgi:xanthine dehydrogenase large subunit
MEFRLMLIKDSTYFEHDSAIKHVTGKATYTDDIAEPKNLLHAAIGYSTISKGEIIEIDYSNVYKSKGVIEIITEKDIEGVNEIGPVFKGDPIFTSKKIQYHGQPIFAVAATSYKLARKATAKVKIKLKEQKPILGIKEALKKKSFVHEPQYLKKGEALNSIKKAKNTLKGELYSGGQDHFYLEGQIAMTIPQEDNNFLIYSSTQHPSETQKIIAKVLKQKFNTIKVKVRRIGGGFGGKESQSFLFAAITSIFSKKLNKPVKLKIDRDDDMIITGKRHDFFYKYEVGFNDQGVIKGLKVMLASRCGVSPDLSKSINDRAIYHIDNAYFIPHIDLVSYRCKTNTVSNTAFRGFGGPQGMFCIENIIENISQYLKIDSHIIRTNNFYQIKNNNITPYDMKIEDNIIQDLFSDLIKSSNYIKRRKNIDEYNKKNIIFKKGLSITPVKFGISFTTSHLNQAGSLIHIYTDGSIHLNHGGIEMGQGLMIKIAQLTAIEFGIDLNNIKITSTNTEKIPNTSASAASASTDLNGAATIDAINKIKQNLKDFIRSQYKYKMNNIIYKNNYVIFGKNKIFFKELITQAYLNRVSLSSTGFYKTPKIYVNKKTLKGRPFLYFSYGAAVSEVIVDTLTGENKLTQVDILHDVGKSINPRIDIGQIEGGFTQGLGWLTTEEISWDNKGLIKTHSPSTYKIPTSSDLPKKFNVKIYKKGVNKENVVNKSKAVGEPPLMLALSVFMALKDAIKNKNIKLKNLKAPATPENILLNIN